MLGKQTLAIILAALFIPVLSGIAISDVLAQDISCAQTGEVCLTYFVKTPNAVENFVVDYETTDANNIVVASGSFPINGTPFFELPSFGRGGSNPQDVVTFATNPAPYTLRLIPPPEWSQVSGTCFSIVGVVGDWNNVLSMIDVPFQDGGLTSCEFNIVKDDTFDDNLDEMMEQYNELLTQVTALQAENDQIKSDVRIILRNMITASQSLLAQLE